MKHLLQRAVQSVPLWWVVLGIVAVEAVSLWGWFEPSVAVAAAGVLIAATFGLALWKLEVGVLLVLTELFIGSKGRLFALELFGIPVSVRLGMFLALSVAAVVWMVRERRIGFFDFRYRWQLVALVGVVLLGAIVGAVSGNGLSAVFLDGNGYLYLGLAVPLTQVRWTRAHWERLVGVLIAAFIAVLLKTMVMLFLFSHVQSLEGVAQVVYRWVRDTGVGEITRLENGFARVFFQHHIYAVVLLFVSLPFVVRESTRFRSMVGTVGGRWALFLSGASLLILFLSGSRSMWVGLIAAFVCAGILSTVRRMVSWKQLVATGVILVSLLTVDYAILFGVVNVPLPGTISIDAGSLLTERTKNLGSEAAAAARWNLLPVLAEASLEHPLLGSGLGATVSYASTDPRALEASDGGLFTTYSFEWGYLDFAYKFGAVGLLVGLWVVYVVVRDAWRVRTTYTWEWVGIVSGAVGLAATHIFTPYLNHPLGIGWVLVLLVWLSHRVHKHHHG